MIDLSKLGAIYLASPYSDDDPAVRAYRYDQAKQATVLLLNAGAVAVYSPIAMLGDQYSALPKSWDFWRVPSLDMLSRMDSLVVLTLPGWRESVGVQAEINYCRQQEFIQEPPGLYPLPFYMDDGIVSVYPMREAA